MRFINNKGLSRPCASSACATRARSKHIAGYLAGKRYETDFAGANPLALNRVSQHRVDWADVVIPLTPGIGEALEEGLDLAGKKVVVLHALRDPAHLGRARSVYDAIEREIGGFLPL